MKFSRINLYRVIIVLGVLSGVGYEYILWISTGNPNQFNLWAKVIGAILVVFGISMSYLEYREHGNKVMVAHYHKVFVLFSFFIFVIAVILAWYLYQK